MDNWAELAIFFKYPAELRRIIYTTNVIEGFHRQLRNPTKSKSVFPSDESLLKMLYLVTMDVTKKMDHEGPKLGSNSVAIRHIF